ncbi:hypothetical protein L6164_011124 [Bauhinia variegata]|uniref:Uncharacterized protein n=1 Tax=Bauhinia variegata TaxID=167791 RepID=A0ACB9P726_BAUVA|nr:hypothetical protein L6164_011124 [Bauhinia variegata]
MGGGFHILSLLFIFHLVKCSSSHPFCTNSRIPSKLDTPLKFCSRDGRARCDITEDLQLQKEFQALNVTDPACASLLKSILCAADSGLRTVPLLCNTTLSLISQQSSGGPCRDFCSKLWETCGIVSTFNSPFESFSRDRAGKEFAFFTSEKKDVWQSRRSFRETFDGSSDDGKARFNDEAVSFNNVQTSRPSTPAGLCLEKIGNGAYVNMIPHPDGSNCAFFSNQQGKIWLAKLPDEGSNNILVIDESKPFLDITDISLFDSEHGLFGMAFHPDFIHNGRFFLSFNCDQMKHPRCAGRCACNTEVNCDPSKLESDTNLLPCQYQTVVAEFTVNGTASKPSLAESPNPLEVRRIFTMGLPNSGGHAGQILFGPKDGYMYLMISDGSHRDDPYNFAQNKRSLLGKILRLDVENIPSSQEIHEQGLWGSYSIPRDNPYRNDKELAPEIWALGFRNAWRCSFDSKRPSYFLCGDSGQDQYEEIDMVKKGGNYGWRVYEGPYLFHPSESPGGNTSASSINPIFPVLGYDHSQSGSASIIGGYFYRSTTDPCMYGRYLYTDVYSGSAFVGTESPENSGNFSNAKIFSTCARDSPMECSFVEGSSTPELGYSFSLAEDNKKDIYFLTSTGVYRVARPGRCNYSCAKEKDTALTYNRPHSSYPSPEISSFGFLLLLVFLSILTML